MKEIIFSLILILTFSSLGKSQMTVSELSRKTHLEQLKAGILLVQLPNSNEKIEILRKQGKEKRAKKEEKEINKIRENIIKGFQNDWNFSKILFFESKDSKEAFQKNHKVLLDENLKPIKNFPDNPHLYSVRYGLGNPNGEVYRYNGTGFQIRFIKDGSLQTIKYDTFFHAARIRLFLMTLGKKKSTKIQNQINEFNIKLHNANF